LNLTYPPALAGMASPTEEEGGKGGNGHVEALNQSLHRTVLPEEAEVDIIPITDDSEAIDAARKESEAVERQTKLFAGLKFFLGREVPREALVFMIRSVGGEVSWCSTTASGSTYTEEDDRITHQISDREVISNKQLGRFYVQPQWIFDSINQRKKLNEKDYALGETLPPHLSPFIVERRVGDYVPPEEKALREAEEKGEQKKEEKETQEEEEEEEGEEEAEEEDDEEEEEEESGEEGKENEVKVGQKEKKDKEHERRMLEDEEYRLRVMMVQRKHRGLYRSMMNNRKKRTNESKNLERKRKAWDEQNTPEPKKKSKKATTS